MPRLRTIILPAMLAATVGLCGCSPGPALEPTPSSIPGNVPAVRSVVIRFASAMASGNGARACALLDQNARQQVLSAAPTETPGRSPAAACAAALDQVAAEMTEGQRSTLEHLHVGQVTVTGESASIDPSQVSGPAGSSSLESTQSSSAITLEQDGNSWLLDSLG